MGGFNDILDYRGMGREGIGKMNLQYEQWSLSSTVNIIIQIYSKTTINYDLYSFTCISY